MLLGLSFSFFIGCGSEPDIVHPPKAQLRLLTKREYTQTVYDLLLLTAPPTRSCTTDSDCQLSTQSCIDSLCAADPCSTHTFVWEGDTSAEVLLTGDFNEWAITQEQGAWKLTALANQGIQYIKADLENTTHEYAFVVNGSQGSTQSLSVSCTDNGRYNFDPAQSFPSESQPKGFFFDNFAEKGLVSATHIDKYIEAAYSLSQSTDIASLISCDITQEACTADWIREFGLHTFRRPLSTEETTQYHTILSSAPSPEEGIRDALLSFFTSPHFLYRKEIGTETEKGIRILDSYEIASSMSYFLWGSTPDSTLLEAARSQSLLSTEGRKEQAQRMLQSQQAQRHFTDILSLWLGSQDIRSLDKNAFAYYNFSPQTAIAMDQELRLFVQDLVFRRNASYDDLFLSSAGFLNHITASLYEINGVYGPTPQSTTLPALRSAGILSMGAFLSVHAHSDQSSPIKRGVAIRERLLCQDLGEPPPNAGMAPAVDFTSSTQERFAQHTADPSCASCHKYIDPIGLAMERFDGIGQYRESENGVSINPTGELSDVEGIGTGSTASFVTLPQLSEIIVESDRGAQCFVQQMYRFAFGALEETEEEQAIIQLFDQFSTKNRNIQSLMIDIVASESFVRRSNP